MIKVAMLFCRGYDAALPCKTGVDGSRIIKNIIALMFVGPLAWLAEPVYGFNINVLPQSVEEVSFTSFAALLLFAMVVLAVWTVVGRNLTRHRRGPQAEHLFLPCSVSDEAGDPITCHMRTLNLAKVTVVTGRFLSKGDSLRVRLSTLPGFSSNASDVDAVVSAVEVVRGQPMSYIVTLGWGELSSPARAQLGSYISYLSGSKLSSM